MDGVYFVYEGGAEVVEAWEHLVYGVVGGGELVGDIDEHELVASCEAGLALDCCVVEVVVDEELVVCGGDEVLVAVVVEVCEDCVCGGAAHAGAVGFGEVTDAVAEVVAEVWA